MVSASHCVGFTLPGMIELPGSFSGIVISPRPERGPLASQRTSLAILTSAAASVFSAPCRLTSASAAAIASNLLGALTNGKCGVGGDFRGDARAELGMRVEPGAHGGAAQRQLEHVRQRRRDVRARVAELRRVAGEFLPQRQRRRILQVRAPDLDDVGERGGLCRQRRLRARRATAAGHATRFPQPPRSSPSERRRSTTGRD